ncbi:MAG: hypothetical protein AB7E05_11625 [Sphingobium sp.]
MTVAAIIDGLPSREPTALLQAAGKGLPSHRHCLPAFGGVAGIALNFAAQGLVAHLLGGTIYAGRSVQGAPSKPGLVTRI